MAAKLNGDTFERDPSASNAPGHEIDSWAHILAGDSSKKLKQNNTVKTLQKWFGKTEPGKSHPSKQMREVKPNSVEADAGVAQYSTVAEGIMDSEDDGVNRKFYGDSISDAYRMKSELLARHINEIGMGKYQWLLFVVTGCGWIVDNFWSQSIGDIQTTVKLEFSGIVSVHYSSVAYYIGLILGASFWSISADFIGRKPAFNATILLGGIFACAVAGTTNFVGFSALWALIGTACGGNVPVDSMIFLEFVPGSHAWLLTALSAWWNFGAVIVSLLGWGFLQNYSCASGSTYLTCKRSDNMGWRYMMITLGGVAIVFGLIRIFIFKIPESPQFLLSKGRDAEAVESINYIARFNGKPETLKLEMLQEIDVLLGKHHISPDGRQGLTHKQILQENLKDFRSVNIKRLFATRKFAQHTSITWLIWLIIGIAYPLYFNFLPTYLASKFSENSFMSSYTEYIIVSAAGVVGPISAGFAVETRFGRRWMMGISAALTGVFLFAYVGVNSQAGDLAFQIVTGILGNFEYAIMYAFAPESFPGTLRGTGIGIAATLLRVGGLVASLIKSTVAYNSAPIYVSAAMWVVVGALCFGLPFETHGHDAI